MVDVTGDTPVEVGFVPTAAGASDSKEVEVYGTYAYLVNEVGPIQIIDLTDPTNPVQVGLLTTQPGTTDGGTHTHAIVADRLYAHGGRAPGGVRAYSLATPTAPTFLGDYQPYYVHDIGTTLRDGRQILVTAGIYGEGLDVVDATDPAAMTLVTRFNYPGSGAHNVCFTDDGRTAYVGDEIGTTGTWTRIFDLTDLDDPDLVGEIVVDATTVVHNCYVRGDRLYLAHYTEGLRVFDIASPHAPVEVAYYDTYLGPSGGYNGVWAVYPFLPSGRVLVSDRENGLFVVEVAAPVDAEAPPDAADAAMRVAPNPVGATSAVTFRLAAPGDARVSVHDVLGREIAVLAAGRRDAGDHRVRLDARALAAGAYVVRLSLDGRPLDSTLAVVGG